MWYGNHTFAEDSFLRANEKWNLWETNHYQLPIDLDFKARFSLVWFVW